LKMDVKLDCEVDVEGAAGVVDMMDRGEEGALISTRPCLGPNTALCTAHEPLNEYPGLWAFHVARKTRSFPIHDQFPVHRLHTCTAVQRPQLEEPFGSMFSPWLR